MTDQRNGIHLPAPTEDRTTARPHALFLLAAGSTIAGTGLSAGGTAGGLLGTRLAGTEAAAGLPLGMLALGSAAAALRTPRCSSPAYAAATACGPVAAGRAIGLVLFATSIGAVASPLLLGPSDALAESLQLPALTGLYLVAILAYSLAGAALLIASSARAGPERRAHEWRRRAPTRSSRQALSAALLTAPVAAGLATLVLANFVMACAMAVAPLQLMKHGGGMGMTGTAISAHASGMFLRRRSPVGSPTRSARRRWPRPGS